MGADGSLAEVVKRHDVLVLRGLLAKAADVNRAEADGTTPLHIAVQRDDLEMIDLLLRAGANAKAANRYGVTPLYFACLNGSAPALERLISAGADPLTGLPRGRDRVDDLRSQRQCCRCARASRARR